MTVATLQAPRRPLDPGEALGIIRGWAARIPAGTEFTVFLEDDPESLAAMKREDAELGPEAGVARARAEMRELGLDVAYPTRGTRSMSTDRRKYIREFLLERDGPRCVLCGGGFKSKGGRRACIEHLVPVSKGGTDEIENLGLSHVACNERKADQVWDPLTRTPLLASVGG